MKLKTFGAAVVVAACWCSMVRAQAPSYAPVPPAATTAAGAETPTPATHQTVGNSRWITPTACLCESDGVSPPIGAEIYIYSGASMPFGSQLLSDELCPGFVIGGGLRTMFFNDAMDAAWVIDTGLNHFVNRARHARQFPLKVIDFTGETIPIGEPNAGQPEVKLVQYGTPIRPGLFIRDTDRTFVNLGAGRDWYLKRSADSDGPKWRIGVDAGGRYGTLSQEYDRIKHRTDVIGGFYTGAHHDLELPSKWGILVLGLRCEYSYTWSDILQTASDLQEINVMLTIGVSY
jgi:hypothetical protein